MPAGSDDDTSEGGAPPKLTLWQRLLLILPSVRKDPANPRESRLKGFLLKPVDPSKDGKTSAVHSSPYDTAETVEELEAAIKYADDKERLTGLMLAPIGAAIGFLITRILIADDPAATVHGKTNILHVNPSLYLELGGSVVLLSVLMLIMSFFRKRLPLGIVMALYGLGVFNLHYWGFGIPFILVGAWLLVRSYRLHARLREATGDFPTGQRTTRTRRASQSKSAPNKRFTPPTPSRRRPSTPKPD